jgi:hypothetical protein
MVRLPRIWPCCPFRCSLTLLCSLFVFEADGELQVPGYPLQECQGDCDDDDECAGDLICFQRDGTEVVPGCVGVPEEKVDYCIKPPQELVESVAISRSGAKSFP